jgi:multiple sugar transport system permease protein
MIKGIGIMTGIHSLIPLYAMFNGLNLINSYLPLVLIYLFHSIAFSVFTIKTYLDHLPAGLQETALLEGMKPAAYLLKVLFPLSWPVIATSVMISFLNAWNGFLAPLLFLNDDAKYTISIKLYSFVGSIGSGEPQWNLFAATSVVNLGFIIILFLFLKNKLAYSPVTEYED